MKRTIIGFHLDENGDWVANLDCAHGQHVRHRPPFVSRPWVVSEAGREAMLGAELDCVRCDRMEWPDGCVACRRTPEFDETTVPAGLRSEHATRRGVWARIHVIRGVLRYHVGPPIDRSFQVGPASSAVIVPEVRHRVEPEGPVRFFLEFSRAKQAMSASAGIDVVHLRMGRPRGRVNSSDRMRPEALPFESGHTGGGLERPIGRDANVLPTEARNRAMRSFNTTGPVKPDKHYCIPPLARLDLDEVLRLVHGEKYFVLHAPRQTGKTSTLLALCDLLNGQGYQCVYTTVEGAHTAHEDVERAMRAMLAGLALQARLTLGDHFLNDAWPGILAKSGPDQALSEALALWAEASPKPLVLLIDEIDTLQGDPLLSVLQQLRAGYPMHPDAFPQCVVLCGLRDVRDYRIRSTSSPFNIVAESLRLGDFTQEETLTLLDQHTEETGQAFTDDAREAIWTQTLGQPWLVNALAYETCFKRKAGRDRTRAVSADDVAEAREALIVRRVTHLDQLADKLREDRVRRVVEPMLSGVDERRATNHDIEYVRDLGLIARDKPVRIANPIYAEVVPRELGWILQEELDLNTTWYVDADDSLNLDRLMEAFQDFFRRHSEHWKNRFMYEEAWPQILLQAYLHRVVNGGGRIEREYGLGRGRVDLLITWPQSLPPEEPGGVRVREYVVECKVARAGDGLESTVRDGVEQTAGYMARCAAEAGHLVVIDQREGRSWEEKVFRRQRRSENGVPVEVWGM